VKNFAMLGVGGFIAPRHLQAIRDTGNRLVAALDPHDAVGVLDRWFDDVSYFQEFERFDRFVEKLRRKGPGERVDVVSICSPNYLHDAHIRFALRVGADAICEKPMVLNPWNLDALAVLEKETGRRVWNVLQLRLHPAIRALRERVAAEPPGTRHAVDLAYVTSRGRWYDVSWKGQLDRSGGITTNIGIHFFDMLCWIFGPPRAMEVHKLEARRAAGWMDLERASVRWFLSIDKRDVPPTERAAGKSTYRSLTINGDLFEFSDGFADLHTEVYREVLAGRGFGIEDARQSVTIAHAIRTAPVVPPGPGRRHPALEGA
jgi:UDP-N-acetyl-2-amino-2-deoxyglucuronate dehydrogenase